MGPDLTQVGMSQAVELVLIQAGVSVLGASGLLVRAGCSGETGLHSGLSLSLSVSLSVGFESSVCVWFLHTSPVSSPT